MMSDNRAVPETVEVGTSGNYRIVRAAEEHLAGILEIEKETISPPWSRESLRREICGGDSFFCVAEADSREPENSAESGDVLFDVLGFAIVRRFGDDCELLQIAVGKTFQRQGVGGRLLRAALCWAGSAGAGAVFLEVRRSNTAAVRLYEKHGFTHIHTRINYYSDPVEDALIMKFSISKRCFEKCLTKILK